MNSGNRAFTLIELLIVVAIIAIVCGSSLTIITGPAYEMVRSGNQEAFETGAGTLFAALVQDAHNCSSMDAGTSGTVQFILPSLPGNAVTYTITSGTLTRQQSGLPFVNLVPDVSGFYVSDQLTSGLVTFSLEGNLRGYSDGYLVKRTIDINVGSQSWTGNAL